jgi:hypothetical protein
VGVLPRRGARTAAGVAVDGRANVYVAVWSIATENGNLFGLPDSDGQVGRVRFLPPAKAAGGS